MSRNGGNHGPLQASTYEAQLNWIGNQVEWVKANCAFNDKAQADVLMFLSIAESVKLARQEQSRLNDLRAKQRLHGGPVVMADTFLEFIGPKEDADAFLDGESYTIEIGDKKYVSCMVRARRDLGVDGFWAVEFKYQYRSN